VAAFVDCLGLLPVCLLQWPGAQQLKPALDLLMLSLQVQQSSMLPATHKSSAVANFALSSAGDCCSRAVCFVVSMQLGCNLCLHSLSALVPLM
jgi:hypothetical protein